MLFSSRKNDKLILIVDVESTKVRGTLVLEREGAKPRVQYTHDESVAYKEGRSGETLVESITAATKTIIDNVSVYIHSAKIVSTDLPHKISSVHYVLSSPWILSESKKYDEVFKSPRLISEDLIKKILHDEREKLAALVNAQGKVTQVEEKLFDVRLNGYSVSSWKGKRADTISVSFVVGVSGTKMVERLKNVCAHIVKPHAVAFHSSLLMQYIGTNEIERHREMFVIIHAHSEITDVVVANEETCTFFATFPIGSQTILRSIAKDSGLGTNTAESMVNISSTGVTSPVTNGSIEVIVSNNAKWQSALEVALKPVTDTLSGIVPIVVLANDRQSDFARSLMEKYPKAKIAQLSADELNPHIDYDPAADRSVIAGLYVLAVDRLQSK